MIEYVIRFPGEWYLRGTIATGDIRQADFFQTEALALAALAKVARNFKPDQVKNIEVIKIGG